MMNLIESLFRWIHVWAGILWIGLLYFFLLPPTGPEEHQQDCDDRRCNSLWSRHGPPLACHGCARHAASRTTARSFAFCTA